MKTLLAAIIVVLAAAGVPVAAELPDYEGPINDRAGVLDRDDVQRLEAKALAYRDSTGNEIGVLIVPTLDDRSVEDYAHDIFAAWGIGKKDKDNGVLFLAAIEERKARIEVGYGLEAELTDLECGRLVNRDSPMAQHFRQGDYAGGVDAVLDGIAQAIGGEYQPPPPPENEDADRIPMLVPIGFFLVFLLFSILRRRGITGRKFGGPFFGGFGGGFGGGRGGGGGFTFGGGSSGGGGASGGW